MVTKRAQGNVSFDRRDGEWRVQAVDELDRVSAPELVDAVVDCLAQEALDVVLDLSATTYLDGGGLAAIEECRQRCTERGRSLSIAPVLDDGVARVLRVVGLHELIRPA